MIYVRISGVKVSGTNKCLWRISFGSKEGDDYFSRFGREALEGEIVAKSAARHVFNTEYKPLFDAFAIDYVLLDE